MVSISSYTKSSINLEKVFQIIKNHGPLTAIETGKFAQRTQHWANHYLISLFKTGRIIREVINKRSRAFAYQLPKITLNKPEDPNRQGLTGIMPKKHYIENVIKEIAIKKRDEGLSQETVDKFLSNAKIITNIFPNAYIEDLDTTAIQLINIEMDERNYHSRTKADVNRILSILTKIPLKPDIFRLVSCHKKIIKEPESNIKQSINSEIDQKAMQAPSLGPSDPVFYKAILQHMPKWLIWWITRRFNDKYCIKVTFQWESLKFEATCKKWPGIIGTGPTSEQALLKLIEKKMATQ